jgi:hypothetical protein
MGGRCSLVDADTAWQFMQLEATDAFDFHVSRNTCSMLTAGAFTDGSCSLPGG